MEKEKEKKYIYIYIIHKNKTTVNRWRWKIIKILKENIYKYLITSGFQKILNDIKAEIVKQNLFTQNLNFVQQVIKIKDRQKPEKLFTL